MINNVQVYGLEESLKASKYPMSVDINTLDSSITNTIKTLGQSKIGSGHDNWLNGIIVQFDLSFTIKAWTEAERYHFFDFVSSQSSMHRITKFDLDKAYIEYVDNRIVNIMKEKVDTYNKVCSINTSNYSDDLLKLHNDQKKMLYLNILYSNPCGMKLTARMTTNYRQLKTIYYQRKNHRLGEWRDFCKWIESLPYFKELILGN